MYNSARGVVPYTAHLSPFHNNSACGYGTLKPFSYNSACGVSACGVSHTGTCTAYCMYSYLTGSYGTCMMFDIRHQAGREEISFWSIILLHSIVKASLKPRHSIAPHFYASRPIRLLNFWPLKPRHSIAPHFYASRPIRLLNCWPLKPRHSIAPS